MLRFFISLKKNVHTNIEKNKSALNKARLRTSGRYTETLIARFACGYGTL